MPVGLDSDGRCFATIFALILAVEYWARAFPRWVALDPVYFVSLPVVTVLCALAASRWRRWAFAALALVHVRTVWAEFPAAGNHAYLEVYFCLLLAFLDLGRPAEARLLVGSIKWLTGVVLFYSGVQKLVHGYYFGGEMLAYAIETNSFQPFLQLLLPDAEFQRFLVFKGQPGDGPYTVASPFFLVVSNLVWIAEIGLSLLLLFKRTAQHAALAAIAMLFAIEAGAREVFFGLVYANALLLFLPPQWHRRSLPAFAAVLALMFLSRAGVLPDVTFY